MVVSHRTGTSSIKMQGIRTSRPTSDTYVVGSRSKSILQVEVVAFTTAGIVTNLSPTTVVKVTGRIRCPSSIKTVQTALRERYLEVIPIVGLREYASSDLTWNGREYSVHGKSVFSV